MEFAYTPYKYDDNMASPFAICGDASSSSSQHYQSEPLSRYGSSEGSTQGSSAVASPIPGHEYYSFNESPCSVASPRTHHAQLSPGSVTVYYGSPDLDVDVDAEQDLAQPRGSSDERHSRS